MKGTQSLCAIERETVISWSESDDVVEIYTTQRRMMTKLLKNPLFKLKEEIVNEAYKCNPIGLRGTLPIKSISLRTKLSKPNTSQASMDALNKHRFTLKP